MLGQEIRLSSLILLLLTAGSWPDSLVTLGLTFDWEQWLFACDHYYEEIWLEGILDSDQGSYQVRFRIRGETSRAFPKKSLKVEILDGELFGYSELNLNAQYLDRSRIRECISYEFNRAVGLCVPETGFTELLFNGETQGAYLFVQDVDGDFTLETILPDDAVIYKAVEDGSSLNRSGDLTLYAKKTFQDDQWDDLELLIAWLVNSPDSMYLTDLDSRIHWENVTTLIAVNVLIGHGSTYYHNYHAVLDSPGATGRWRLITWDMDRTWGKSYDVDWPYYSSSNGSNYPNTLIWRSWCMEILREHLLDRVDDLSDDLMTFAAGGIIDSLALLVEPLVEVDPFRDYTMEEFHDELEVIRAWPDKRLTYLEQMEDWPLPFHTMEVIESTQGLIFSWTGAGAGCIYTLGISTDSTFSDQAALVFETSTADTSFTLQGWNPPVPLIDLYWTVFADNGFRSEKALNWFLPLVSPPDHPWSGKVVINEVCYFPSAQYPSGDWIELTNAGPDTVSLEGWSFRDGSDRHLHTIGTYNLPPGGFMVIYSDSLLFRSLHPGCTVDDDGFDFGLSVLGEVLRLYDLSGRLVDRVAYQPGPPWPGLADGATLALLHPLLDNSNPAAWTSSLGGGTPGYSNDSPPGGASAGCLLTGPARPSPCRGSFSIDVGVPFAGIAEIGMYDLSGRLVLPTMETELSPGVQRVDIDTGGLPSGLYFTVIRFNGAYAAVSVVALGME